MWLCDSPPGPYYQRDRSSTPDPRLHQHRSHHHLYCQLNCGIIQACHICSARETFHTIHACHTDMWWYDDLWWGWRFLETLASTFKHVIDRTKFELVLMSKIIIEMMIKHSNSFASFGYWRYTISETSSQSLLDNVLHALRALRPYDPRNQNFIWWWWFCFTEATLLLEFSRSRRLTTGGMPIFRDPLHTNFCDGQRRNWVF